MRPERAHALTRPAVYAALAYGALSALAEAAAAITSATPLEAWVGVGIEWIIPAALAGGFRRRSRPMAVLALGHLWGESRFDPPLIAAAGQLVVVGVVAVLYVLGLLGTLRYHGWRLAPRPEAMSEAAHGAHDV